LLALLLALSFAGPAAALPPTYDLVFLDKPIKVNEGDLANIEVQLVGATCIGWSGVDWSTSAAPAPANPLPAELSDFQNPAPPLVGFSSGAGETITVQLQTVADADAEDDVVSLTLSSSNPEIVCSAQFPTFSSYSVDVIIVDSAPPPTARISSLLGLSVVEGDVGDPQPEIQVTVVLDNPPPAPFSYHVKLGTLGQSATSPGDFPSFLADVHFQGGDAGPFVFTIRTNPDNVPEGDEGFLIKLFDPDPGLLLHPDHAVNVTINNDDATPQVAVLDLSWPEGSGGGTANAMVTFQVTDAPIGVPFDIHWRTDSAGAPSPATPGVDYQQIPPTIVTLTADSSTDTMDVPVPVFRDNDSEPDEGFFVRVDNASFGATLTDPEALVTIVDDDIAQLATVEIADNGPVVEGDAGTRIMNFTVTVTGTAAPGSTVHYATFDDTAVAGQDYQAASGTLQLGGTNPNVQTIQVAILGDQAVEGLETFFVQLDNPDGVGIGTATAKGTIDDDDNPLPPPRVSIEDITLAEGDAGQRAATFIVSLDAPSASPLSFTWTTFDGTATTAGNDYLQAAGNALIPAGETTYEITVQVLGDNLVEPDETFEVLLDDLAGGVFTSHRATATITNDDVPGEYSFSIGDVTVTEGDAGLTVATFTVTLTEARGTIPTVDYSTVAGSAAASSDFQPTSGQLVFSEGATSKTITVNVIGDTAVEPDETFTVQLANPTGGATLGHGAGIGTIANDDSEAPPAPILSVADAAEVAEGNSGATQVVFEVRLDRASDAVVTAGYATFDGSATTADQDYQGQTGQIVIPPGATTATVTVQAIGDTKVEADENFGLALSNVSGAELGRSQAVGRLKNDDEEAPPVEGSSIRLASAEPVAEGAGFAVVVVERSGAAIGSASARLVALAGTAAAGDDFAALNEEMTWAAGETGEREVRVPLVSDNLQEGDETIRVAIEGIRGAAEGRPLEGEVVILDDDAPLRLELIGAAERSAEVGQELELAVRAVREDGMPVAGALVDFEAQSGPVRLLGEGPAQTDAEGVAGRRVALGPAPGNARVRAVLRGGEAEASFLIRVAGNLGELGVGSGGDRNVGDILDQSCAGATGQLAEACAYLYGLEDPADRRRALAELTPQGVVAQLRSALQAPKNQNRNVGSRLDALRGGAPLQTLDQLSMSVQGQSLGGVGALQQSLLRGAATAPRAAGVPRTSPRTAPGLDQQIDRDSGWEEVRERDGEKVELALFKARHGHAPLAKQDPGAATGQDGGFDYGDESRWGMFVNGRMSFGDAPRRGTDPGYDFETDGLTAGVDYRLNERMVVGAAFGWVSTSSELADGGGIDTDGWSLNLYGTWYRERWYVETVLGYGRNDYDFKRVIALPEIFQGRDSFVAVGSPKSDQLSAELGAGYDFQLGEAGTLSGFGRFSYVDTAIDGYAESGGGPFGLAFADQELDSLLGEAGVELSYPWSVSWGVLQPLLRVSFLHEFEDDAQVIRARFLADGSQRFFVVRSERPDRDYMNLAAGISATLPRGWATFLQYDTDLEREELDIYTLSGGFRFQF
jgi:outer membrane autotransporter protein